MKKVIPLFLLLFFFSNCEKWNLEKEDFLQLTTGEVILLDIKNISIESEVLGIVNEVVTQHGHVYSTSTMEPTIGFNDGIATEGGRDSDGNFISTVADLELNKTYNIRAFAQTKNLISYGNTQSFTTGNVMVSTGGLEYTTEREARVSGSLCCLEFGVTIDQYGFCWSSENENPTIDNDPFVNLGIPETDGPYSGELTDLKDSSLYYYRSYAVTNFGTDIIYGEVKTWDARLINIWKQRANFPVEDIFLPAFSFNGNGFVFHENSLWKYEPADDSWSVGPQKSGPFLFTSSRFIIGNYAYFMIGTTASDPPQPGNICWRYDLVNEVWEDLNPFDGDPRISPIGFTTGNGKGYAGIGNSGSNDYSFTDFWEYDPLNDSWTEITTYPGMTNGISMISFTVEGKAYVGGGGGAGLQNFYCFNPNNNTWTLKGGLPGGQTFETVSFTIGQTGYMGTGESDGAFQSRSFWSYAPLTDEWNRIADFAGQGRFGAFGFSIGNKGYVGGGVGMALFTDFWEYKATLD